ncbi:MAG: NPCBM/NEW2 domain-containing protein [bacterium]
MKGAPQSPIEKEFQSTPSNRPAPWRHAKILLAVLFAAALLIRWVPARFGLPYLHYWDEPTYVKLACHILKTGGLDHQWYRVPPFFLYQQAAVQTLRVWAHARQGEYPSLQTMNLDDLNDNREIGDLSIIRWGRKYTAWLGALMCVLLYGIARSIVEERAALAAALVLAFMPGHIEHSLFITPDMPMAFLALLTVYWCLRTPSDLPLSHLTGLGMLAGLTAATKFNGGCVAVAPWILLGVSGQGNLSRYIALILGTIFGFTLGFPYWALRLTDFITGVGAEIYHYHADFIHSGYSHRYGLDFLIYLFTSGLGWIPSVFAAAGLIAFLRRPWKREDLIWLSFPLVYTILILSQKANFPRILLPLFPWFALLAGSGLVGVWDWLRPRLQAKLRESAAPAASAILLFVLLLPPGWLAGRILFAKETRIQLADWLSLNSQSSMVTGIPRDLRFLSYELRRMNGPVVLLERSDIQDQTRSGLDWLVCGIQPSSMKLQTLLENHGVLDSPSLEAQKTAEGIRRYVARLTPLVQFAPRLVYPPGSTLASFHEGYWLLGEWSVNPRLAVFKAQPNERWLAIPAAETSYKADSWKQAPPQFQKTLRGNPLAIGRVQYETGFGTDADTTIIFPTPAGAQRFLVDVGLAGDAPDNPRSAIIATVWMGQKPAYQSPVLRKNSPIWRVDMPLENAPYTAVSIRKAEPEGDNTEAVIGYGRFFREQ